MDEDGYQLEKTLKGLRNAIFDELEMLINGGSNIMRARAVARLGDVILKSVLLELYATGKVDLPLPAPDSSV